MTTENMDGMTGSPAATLERLRALPIRWRAEFGDSDTFTVIWLRRHDAGDVVVVGSDRHEWFGGMLVYFNGLWMARELPDELRALLPTDAWESRTDAKEAVSAAAISING